MEMIVVDSDILIDCLRNKPEGILALNKAIATGEAVTTTIINAQEVISGKENAKVLIADLGTLDYSWDEMLKTVDISNELYKNGTPIGELDEMIAGICLANNASLLTKNKKHFSKIKGLEVKNFS